MRFHLGLFFFFFFPPLFSLFFFSPLFTHSLPPSKRLRLAKSARLGLVASAFGQAPGRRREGHPGVPSGGPAVGAHRCQHRETARMAPAEPGRRWGGLSQGNGFALFLSFMSHPQPVWHQVRVGVAGTQDPVLSPCPQHWGCHRVLGNGAVGRACPAVELSAGGRANPAAVADESIILMLSFELCFFGRREVG